ncbi:MAG TPA: hypothetical protein VGM13_02685 [Thermoanaerobaculia bacterium]|jgi:hypothetical protein
MKTWKSILTLAIAAGALTSGLAVVLPAEGSTATVKSTKPLFYDVHSQTKQFIAWSDSIRLTPEQEKIKEEVLSSIPTTCCKKFSMLTCCCACNMAKTIWGLSNHMLAHEGADARRLRATVLEWTQFIGKKGFTGDACFKGGCSRPFAENGCGGMDADHVVF